MNRRDFLCAAVALPASSALPAIAAPAQITIDLASRQSFELSVAVVFDEFGEMKFYHLIISDEFAEFLESVKHAGY